MKHYSNLLSRFCAGSFLSLFFLTFASIGSLRADTLIVSPITLIATNLAYADSDVFPPGRPGVSSDGTNYLVIAPRTVQASTDFISTLLDANGNTLHQSTFNADFYHGPGPRLAFDGTNYLLVFHSHAQIYGLLLGPDGKPIGPNSAFQISSGNPSLIQNFAPSVAFDGENFLVVWGIYEDQVASYRIAGALVTPQGRALAEFPIRETISAAYAPQVAFQGSAYLVVWEESGLPNYDPDIKGTRVSPDGTVLDPDGISICTAVNSQRTPHLASDGTNWLVVWQDKRNYNPNTTLDDIYAVRVSVDGVLLDGPADTGGIPVNTRVIEFKGDPRVCFDGRNFFVTWSLSRYDQGGIFANRVSPDGSLLDAPENDRGVVVKTPDCDGCKVVLANPIFNGKSVLVPWVNNTEAEGTYKSVHGNIVTARTDMGDVFWQHTDGRAVSWFLEQTRFLGAHRLAKRLPEWRLMAQPDMNSNGTKDLLWQHRDGRLGIWYMDGTKFVSAAPLRSANAKWTVAGTGHFNNDTNLDIVFRNTNGTAAVWFMNNTNFLGSSLVAGGSALGSGWTLRLVGNLDGDSAPDLLWQNADGRLILWTMEGTAAVKSIVLPKIGKQWIATGIADFNADDKNDILFQNLDRRSAVRLMDGTNVISFALLKNGAALGTGWRIVGPK